MRQLLPLFLLLSFAVVCSSCAPKIYLPERANAPMLREAGDVKLTSSLKIQNNSNAPKTVLSPSLDFAVSPVTGLGLIASYRKTNRYADEDEDYDNTYGSQDSVRYEGSRWEFGAGYYMPFGGKGLFEIYGGGAVGSMDRRNLEKGPGIIGNYNSKYYQIFLQPSIGFYAKEVFDMCGGVKFNIHKYSSFTSDNIGFRREFTDPRVDIEDPTFVLVGPFMNLNVGYKYAKFNMQFGANFNVGKPRLRIETPFYMSMGITLELSPRFWRGDAQDNGDRRGPRYY